MNQEESTKTARRPGLGRLVVTAALSFPLLAMPVGAAEIQLLRGHVPAVVAGLQPTGRLATSKHLDLAIGLPLRNREALTNLLQQIYDPASTNFHHYLTPEQFTKRFGPTETDYQKLENFARTNG